MSVFGTSADGMFRYFVCPNDKFVLNSLEETDRDGIIYRILKSENYQRILFVENDGSYYKIFAYDTLSELSYKHRLDFENTDLTDKDSVKAFYEKTQGKQTKNSSGPAGLNLGISFGKKTEDSGSKSTFSSEYGKRVVAEFSQAKDFLDIFIKLINALEFDKVQTAIVMQMDLLTRVNSPKVRDFMEKATSAHTGKNILLYVVEKKELLSNIVKRDEIHYLHPMLLEFFESSRCGNGSADVIEELQKRNIIVVADKIGSDEVANCILRKKIIKKDARFENIPVSKVYSLAELLVEDLLNINKKKHFKHIPEKVDNYIAFFSGCLDDDSFVKTLEEKCNELCSREIALARDNNVLHLERITHKDNHFSVISEQEKNKNYSDIMETLNSMIGLQPVKEELNSIFETITVMGKDTDAWYSYVFAGNPGTGKTQVARLMGRILKTIGVLEKGHVVEVTKSDIVAEYIGQSGPKTRAACEKALGGVLFLDEAYELVKTEGYGPDTFSDDFCKEAYNTIMNFMYNHRGEICFIFAGYPEKMQRFINADPGMQRRISSTLYFPDYSIDELYSIFEIMAKKSGFKLADNVRNIAITRIKDIKSGIGDNFGNAGEMEKLLDACKRNIASRITKQLRNNSSITPEERYVILPEDLGVDTDSVGEEAFNVATKELYELIGLQSVKEQITLLMNQIKYSNGNDSDKEPGHYVFAGNPGTGKTVVARLMGKIFKAIGVLPKGHVVEVSKATLVAGYVGQTQGKVQELCESALGGVLFVDEAYQLFAGENSGADFGKDAIEVIMKFMEDNRKNVSVIFAGYEDKMNELYKVNSGLDSRISKTIKFTDYTVEELVDILKLMMSKENLSADDKFFGKVYKYISEYKKSKSKDFGNAREIRKILNELDQNKASRLASKARNGEYVTDEDKSTLLSEDIPAFGDSENMTYEEAMEKLNSLIGLQNVKHQITSLLNKQTFSSTQTQSKEPGHYIFSGNPGTGKTEVARLMGKIFKALGLLEKGHVVEVSKATLVAGYEGQTQGKTQELCESALGGVLFVDEAYQLFAGENSGVDFGKEALEVIMKFMEDNRNSVSVIFAGYEQKMNKLYAVNEGLKSRISQIISFPDYTADELVDILKLMMKKANLVADTPFFESIKSYLASRKIADGKNFGNAREVRKTLDLLDQNKANRLAFKLSQGGVVSEADKSLLLIDDIPKYNETTRDETPKNTYRKLDKQLINTILSKYEPKSYTKQEISTVIDKSILFVRTDTGCGTAFLISPDGYAVTCNHVIEGARQINARLRIPGRIGGADSWHECTVVNTRKDIDIAVIKLTGSNFPYLNTAKPERKIIRGEDFVLMGYPFGNMTANDPTMFAGSISSSENQRDENGYMLYYINSEAKSGHSGSPIVSLSDGCVIGVLLGSITNQSGDLTEEINYMRPITYLWEEFME